MTMLVSAVKNAGLDDAIDAIYSVDRRTSSSPHPSVYQIAVDELKIPAPRISFQSANGWDAHGAAAFGFRVAWIIASTSRRKRCRATSRQSSPRSPTCPPSSAPDPLYCYSRDSL